MSAPTLLQAHRVSLRGKDAAAPRARRVAARLLTATRPAQVLPLDTPPEQLRGKYGAIIISGGAFPLGDSVGRRERCMHGDSPQRGRKCKKRFDTRPSLCISRLDACAAPRPC